MCVTVKQRLEKKAITYIKCETKIRHFKFIVSMHKNESPPDMHHFKWRLPGGKNNNNFVNKNVYFLH